MNSVNAKRVFYKDWSENRTPELVRTPIKLTLFLVKADLFGFSRYLLFHQVHLSLWQKQDQNSLGLLKLKELLDLEVLSRLTAQQTIPAIGTSNTTGNLMIPNSMIQVHRSSYEIFPTAYSL